MRLIGHSVIEWRCGHDTTFFIYNINTGGNTPVDMTSPGERRLRKLMGDPGAFQREMLPSTEDSEAVHQERKEKRAHDLAQCEKYSSGRMTEEEKRRHEAECHFGEGYMRSLGHNY